VAKTQNDKARIVHTLFNSPLAYLGLKQTFDRQTPQETAETVNTCQTLI